MKIRDIIKLLERDGWALLPRTGTSHRQYKRPAKPGRVTAAGHFRDDVDPGTRSSILKQPGLK